MNRDTQILHVNLLNSCIAYMAQNPSARSSLSTESCGQWNMTAEYLNAR